MWEKVQKETHNSLKQSSIVIRNTRTISFNTEFTKEFNIEMDMGAEFFFSSDGSSMGIKVQRNDLSEDSYIFSNDGGGRVRKSKSLIIQATSIFKKSSKLKELGISKNRKMKKLFLKKEKDDFFEFSLIPCFEQKSIYSTPSMDDIGIYRLMLENKVVYIGRGKVKSRTSSHRRFGLIYDNYEYSLLQDNEDAIRWEKYYIDDYLAEYGKLPLYNKIKGADIDK